MKVIRFDGAEPYEPPGHTGVVNRLLVGRGSGEVTEVSVWHGAIEPGGGADPHVHAEAVQVYVVVSGVVTVSDEESTVDLGPGDAAIFAAGDRHEVVNAGEGTATLYVVSAPALR
ncbi:MAG TPA: cupin domain-containing protein [Acidimicrobiia bacterium]|nr:cupin domain-containing protein [Acidimicrobiia bacterium]